MPPEHPQPKPCERCGGTSYAWSTCRDCGWDCFGNHIGPNEIEPEHPQPARAVEGWIVLRSDGTPYYPSVTVHTEEREAREEAFYANRCDNDDVQCAPCVVLTGHRAAALEELVAAAEALDVLTVETMSSMSPYAIDGLIEKARAALRRWKGE